MNCSRGLIFLVLTRAFDNFCVKKKSRYLECSFRIDTDLSCLNEQKSEKEIFERDKQSDRIAQSSVKKSSENI